MLDKDALAPWSNEEIDARTELQHARLRFELAAEGLKEDLAEIQQMARWKDVIRNRPYTSLAVGAAVGLGLGALIARSRRHGR